MDIDEINVSLTPKQASDVVKEAILNGSSSGTLIDCYHRSAGNVELIVLVLEKFFFRSNNRGSVTVTIDNIGGTTKVHAAASGTSQGVIFRFDWGAGESFIESVIKSLEDYRVG